MTSRLDSVFLILTDVTFVYMYFKESVINMIILFFLGNGNFIENALHISQYMYMYHTLFYFILSLMLMCTITVASRFYCALVSEFRTTPVTRSFEFL